MSVTKREMAYAGAFVAICLLLGWFAFLMWASPTEVCQQWEVIQKQWPL